MKEKLTFVIPETQIVFVNASDVIATSGFEGEEDPFIFVPV